MATVDALNRAYGGERCDIVRADGSVRPMAVASWMSEASPADLALFVDACRGRTLDVGCGPGRLVGALAARGVPALGIDISLEAVRHARSRGAAAECRDVFDRVLGEERWEHVLLADGNIGLGGEPIRLLRRAAALLSPAGTILVELAEGSGAVAHEQVRLRIGAETSRAFRWATVGVDAIAEVARATGLVVCGLRQIGGRAVASLSHAGEAVGTHHPQAGTR